MAKNKDDIIRRLINLGLITKDSTAQNLVVALNDILNELHENEYELLLEFETLHKRKVNGEELSFLEESFYKHMKENYSKK